MKTDSLVSIIAPLFNEREYSSDLIENLNFLDGNFEAILVDASDDAGSRETVTSLMQGLPDHSPIRLLNSDLRGRAVQMNFGAASARGDVLLFLHCDTRLPKNAVKLVRKMVDDGVQWGRFDVDLESDGPMYRVIEFMLRIRSRLKTLATGDQAMFVSTELFVRCNGFPEIELMEDIAICKLLNRHSRPGLISVAVVTSARRWHNTGVLSTILLMWKLRFLYWSGADPAKLSTMYRDER